MADAPLPDELGLHPLLWPDQRALVPPRALWVGPQDPFVHFVRWMWEFRAYLVLLCDLSSDSAVLELGCNHGRTMLGLVDYLRPPGRYEGLDIMPAQIAFAQQHIQAAYPHCRFSLADIHNQIYNPGGRLTAEAFAFPYPEEHFDVAYAASLFTHLTPPAAANYLRQTRRVLRPGGRALFSVFVLDYYRGPGTSAWEGYEFNHPLPGHADVAVYNPAMPEQIIAYGTGALARLAGEAGLVVERIVPGFWSATHRQALNEQDLVLLRAA